MKSFHSEGLELGVVLVSAPTADGLRQRARMLLEQSSQSFHAFCHELAKAQHHSHRLAFLATSLEEARGSLAAFLEDSEDLSSEKELFRGHSETPKQIGLLVADIGAEWYECDWLAELAGDAFNSAVEKVLAAGLPDPRSLFSQLRADTEGKVSSAESHAALFAFHAALLDLLQQLGLTFSVVASFSMGEPFGAVACGALSLSQGALVMAAMTDCVTNIEGQGGMLVVFGLSDEEMVAEATAGGLEVGARFAEKGGALTGTLEGLARVEGKLTGDPRVLFMKRPDATRAAYHSEQLLPMKSHLLERLHGLVSETCQHKSTPWYNSISGGLEDDNAKAALDSAFWFKGLRERAHSYLATEALVHTDTELFVELNTRPLYARTVADIAHSAGKQVVAVPAVHRDSSQPIRKQLLGLACRLHCAGASVDWKVLLQHS